MKIWIMNHYAGNQYFDKGGRHYAFAKYLKMAGHSPVVFCSNAEHGTNKLFFESKKLAIIKVSEDIGVPFIFVKSRVYIGNGKSRVLNMLDFLFYVKKTGRKYAKKYGKPDVILASSVHPLTLIAGIKLAGQFGIKCICEIRDLWPESLVAYGIIKKKNLITRLLYEGEKKIYKKSDKIVMTWPGGYDYIRDRGWERIIPHEKVVHISNGVDLVEYKKNEMNYPYADPRFSGYDGFKIVYTGAIKKVNNIGMLLEAAKVLKRRNIRNLKFFIFGDGEECPNLEDNAKKNCLDNIVFMGKVPKREIPSILAQSDINILHNSSTELDRYGQSQNKVFEYLAAGKPILMTYTVRHSVIENNHCGIEIKEQNAESIANAIEDICNMDEVEYRNISNNTLEVVKRYDFAVLSKKLINIIENV